MSRTTEEERAARRPQAPANVPTKWLEGPGVTVWHGDCLDVMREMPAESVHSIVTDPPYGLGFMGRDWDDLPPGEPWALECLRILKPGGHLLAFGGSRTWHRLAVAVEDAGFELRDSIAWLYGSGFPKSMDVSKAIDKAAGAEREVTGRTKGAASSRTESLGVFAPEYDATLPATDSAREWEGWGTALKPAFEPIVVARKPLAGTVAATVLSHGTGALNIDACRVGDGSGSQGERDVSEASSGRRYTGKGGVDLAALPGPRGGSPSGRWPTNVVIDESQADALDEQSGTLTSGMMRAGTQKAGKPLGILGEFKSQPSLSDTYGDSGGASRFFPTFRYEAKAPSSERPEVDGVQHPTVKPLDLMRWLVRLVTPPGGIVFEPFAGSGTTLEAALAEGFDVIGVERAAEYLPLIRARLSKPIDVALDLGVIA